ncbi:MAG: hypothetical protein A2086_02345 [Spirochaetes bacterium GWD1_27_9]|nr:MAG: hypothetical protein A2Z98_03335 [Spirochaetes bacterium GWB1_27_13]OHD24693.1 MAG: hypothetical protein A2Y34_10780 [Spirochaetes bacterium GWC1_27_15]OHD30416.1 MAG: hypothetical protein A2086_02345 [Spirochaetes bacterium GWD1_27_9]
MRKIIILLILFLFSFTIYSNDQFTEDFNTIITIDSINEDFINKDISLLSYSEYFYYYCLVSEELNRYDEFKEWFSNIETQIDVDLLKDFNNLDITTFTEEEKKKLAENLLVYLHNRVFKSYKLTANRISSIIDKGEYNCVSSSLLYGIFLKKYGINCFGIETQDHVFVEIEFQDQKIDVETTNIYGFDPGKKKEVLDNFGKVTGFNYVPAKDYRNRNKVDFKIVFFLIYHNLANFYSLNGNHLKAANIGYIISLGRNDSKGKDEFNVYFNNYVVKISGQKKYQEAIQAINNYIDNFGVNQNFLKIRMDLLANYVVDFNDYSNYNSINDYMLAENERYSDQKDNKRFLELYFHLIYKTSEYFISIKDYEKSYNVLKDFNFRYKNSDSEKIFHNTLLSELNYLNSIKDKDQIKNLFINLKTLFPEYLKKINEFERLFLLNEITELITKNQYENALLEVKKLKAIYSKDNDLLAVQKNCYIKYTVSLYESKDLERTIFFSEEALKEFPNDITFLNNYKAFFQNFFYEAYQKKDYSKARKIINLAKEKFPKDDYFVQMDRALQDKKY